MPSGQRERFAFGKFPIRVTSPNIMPLGCLRRLRRPALAVSGGRSHVSTRAPHSRASERACPSHLVPRPTSPRARADSHHRVLDRRDTRSRPRASASRFRRRHRAAGEELGRERSAARWPPVRARQLRLGDSSSRVASSAEVSRSSLRRGPPRAKAPAKDEKLVAKLDKLAAPARPAHPERPRGAGVLTSPPHLPRARAQARPDDLCRLPEMESAARRPRLGG